MSEKINHIFTNVQSVLFDFSAVKSWQLWFFIIRVFGQFSTPFGQIFTGIFYIQNPRLIFLNLAWLSITHSFGLQWCVIFSNIELVTPWNKSSKQLPTHLSLFTTNKLSFGDRCNVRKKLLERDQIKFTGVYVQRAFTKDMHNMQTKQQKQTVPAETLNGNKMNTWISSDWDRCFWPSSF